MKHRPKINFDMLGIGNGEELIYEENSNVKCIVWSHNKVKYEGEIMSLTRVYGNLINKETTESINGYAHFTYKGEKLSDIRKRLEKGQK